jgi:hypothetical protein
MIPWIPPGAVTGRYLGKEELTRLMTDWVLAQFGENRRKAKEG